MSDNQEPAGVPERQRAYPQVMRLVCESPWAIRAEKLVAIREMLAVRAAGGRFSAEEIEARIGSGPAGKSSSTVATVAVLPIYGVITPRADLMTEMSGGTSVQGFLDSFRAAVANPDIGGILLDVDSPGGMTDLVPEAAAEIRGARGSKPIVAVANTDAASAAYWLASQADEVVVTPSGMVGSIGVFAAHEDVSAAMERDGVKTTLISAGKYKVESNPFEPLSEEARGAIQARVDAFYGMFTRDVAKGRGVAVDAVRGGFGEGRVVTASEALKANMVDRVESFEATVERMITQAASSPRRTQVAFATTVEPPPPGETYEIPQAASSGLSFAQGASASRITPEQFIADARTLRVLSPAKREELRTSAASWRASADAAEALAAQHEPGPDPAGEAVLARGVLAEGLRRHSFLKNGVTA